MTLVLAVLAEQRGEGRFAGFKPDPARCILGRRELDRLTGFEGPGEAPAESGMGG